MEVKIEGELTQERVDRVLELLGEEPELKPIEEQEPDEREPLTLRLNSGGGDVFAALRLYNRLRAYRPGVTVYITGVCMSAATIVACGGHSIMARGGIFMIHNPAAELEGRYEAEELSSMVSALKAIEGTLIEVYRNKTRLSEEELRGMIESETWLSAVDAVMLGFVDEIDDFDVWAQESNGVLYVNSVAIDLRRYKKAEGMRTMERKMSNVDLWEKLQKFFGVKKASEAKYEKTGGAHADAFIDWLGVSGAATMPLVIERLKAADAEIEALKMENERLKVEADAADRICALISDNLLSGSSEVKASSPTIDAKETAIEGVLKYARGNKQ